MTPNEPTGTSLVPVIPISTAIACAATINIDATDLTAVQTMMMEVELERQVKDLLQQLQIAEQTGADAAEELKKVLEQLPERFKPQAEQLQAKLTGFEEEVKVEVTTSIDNETLEGEAEFTIKTGSYSSLDLTKKFKLERTDPVTVIITESTQTIKEMEAKATEIRREIAKHRKTLGNFSRIERLARGAVSLGLLKSTAEGRQLLTQLGVDPEKFTADARDVIKGVIS